MSRRYSIAHVALYVLTLMTFIFVFPPLLPSVSADDMSLNLPLSIVAQLASPSSTPRAYNAATKLYLPLAIKSGAGNPGATPTTTTGPGSSGTFFLPWVISGDAQATDGPSIVVDASGGVHVAYAAYTTNASGKRPAYYVYCATNCTSTASFGTPVALGDKVDHVNLALDSSGHPRMVWVGSDLNAQSLDAYYYASCNAVCTNSANWSATRILGLDNTLPHNSRFFALDSSGRPRFVFYQSYIGAASGTYMAYCDSSCWSVGSWYKVMLTTVEMEFTSLAMTSTGQPRIAALFLDLSTEPALRYLVYLECDTYCSTVAQGAAFPIRACTLCNEPGGYFRLALDSSNRPRLALYTGALEAGRGLNANSLYFFSCNTSCGDLNNSDWNGSSLGLAAGVGTYVDLALDSLNRPRLTYEDASRGLVYAWCSTSCESDSSRWQHALVDSDSALNASDPIPPIPPCAVASWFSGKRSSLALDSAGNPRVAFDAEHWQGLDPVTNPPGSPGCPGFQKDQINARLAVFNQP